MSLYVFGYGSLMNAASASRALMRPVAPADLLPARLCGWRRGWTLRERVFAEALGREVDAVFLDIEARPGAWANGVMIRVSAAERERLVLREKNYLCVDVSAGVGAEAGARVFTFVSRPEFRVANAEPGVFVMRRYVEMVDSACRSIGARFADDYERSTEPIVHPVIDGRYTFVDQEQAKYV